MQKTELHELTDTVERIRKEMYPDLDAHFLNAVVRAEEENPEDDAGAVRAIQTALKKCLSAKDGR